MQSIVNRVKLYLANIKSDIVLALVQIPNFLIWDMGFCQDKDFKYRAEKLTKMQQELIKVSFI